MRVEIEEGNGGYIVTVEGETLPRIYSYTRELQMLEELGKIIIKKRIKVEEK